MKRISWKLAARQAKQVLERELRCYRLRRNRRISDSTLRAAVRILDEGPLIEDGKLLAAERLVIS